MVSNKEMVSRNRKNITIMINKSNTIDNLKVSIFINNLCLLPPFNDQMLICEKLDSVINRINKLIEKYLQSITLLKEFRSSLISEIVTGKIDVRDEVLI